MLSHSPLQLGKAVPPPVAQLALGTTLHACGAATAQQSYTVSSIEISIRTLSHLSALVCKIKSSGKNPSDEIYCCPMFGCRHTLRDAVLYTLSLDAQLENTSHRQALAL